MAKLNPTKTALAVGSFIAAWVLLVSVLLFIGGQAIFDWMLGVHYISGVVFHPVTIGTAIASIITHFIVGLVFGWLFATVWNNVYG
jgi:hypothetical protein